MGKVKKEIVENMTVKQLRAVPFGDWNNEVRCQSLIIVPGGGRKKDLHDSGYRCMSFVAVALDGTPVCQLGGSSDAIHIEGVGGYGRKWLERCGGIPSMVKPHGWNIDCLPISGCLRIFMGMTEIICGPSLSSFEIFAGSAIKETP